ncbi:SulP family inorganic anion transporter [Corallococcus sp. CA054B]|uniref:SulP family inorganic anion transporter n=1 Tax=Corallococcus sp. CA054B TaxID=2316734 RepID=UPI000EA1DF6C|nr:SulP family inorganic anion transporter [Corallococcus sp. CA054B]RKG71771.1 SulP family inorganic anion transporter [Corallococcus sp. CA054B]
MRSTTALSKRPFSTRRAGELIHSWREMVKPSSLPADAAAGLSVACVALPLNVALATAAGLPASVGLVSGVVAGIVGGLLSGSRYQVTGPEAALLPMAAAIVAVHGATGLAIATVLAGVMQVALGLVRAGRFARLIPRPVVMGFTVGIGLLLLNTQLPRLFAVEDTHTNAVALVLERTWGERIGWLGVAAGALTALAMVGLPRVHKRIPAVLVGLTIGTVLMVSLGAGYDAVGALPRSLPMPTLPSFEGVYFASLLPAALGLALLASLGSLLATSSLDALTGATTHSDLDQDLVAQGLANIAAGVFGGFPVMGAIVRASASIQAGARTRAASVLHALWLFVAMALLAPLVARIPIAALTAILLVVGVRLLNLEGLVAMWNQSKSTLGVVLVTALGIAMFNVFVGIGAGLALASLLYVRRHGALRLEVQRVEDASQLQRGLHMQAPEAPNAPEALDLQVARVDGPILFINHLKLYDLVEGPPWAKLVVIDLARVSLVDAAGVATLQYLAEFLAVRGSHLALVKVPPHLEAALEPLAQHLLEKRMHGSLEGALLGAGLMQPAPIEEPVVHPAHAAALEPAARATHAAHP